MGETVRLAAATGCSILLSGTVLSAERFVDCAVPMETAYASLSQSKQPLGIATALSTYRLIAMTPKGCIVQLKDAPYYPPYGYIPKYNQQGNPTLDEMPGTVQIRHSGNSPIYPGFLPLLPGTRYPILRKAGPNLVILYASDSLVATGTIAASECTILTAEFLETEKQQEIESAKRRNIESEIAKASASQLPADAVWILNAIISKYPEAPRVEEARKLLAVKQAELHEFNLKIAAGLVQCHGKWVTKLQAQEIGNAALHAAFQLAKNSADQTGISEWEIRTVEEAIAANPQASELSAAKARLVAMEDMLREATAKRAAAVQASAEKRAMEQALANQNAAAAQATVEDDPLTARDEALIRAVANFVYFDNSVRRSTDRPSTGELWAIGKEYEKRAWQVPVSDVAVAMQWLAIAYERWALGNDLLYWRVSQMSSPLNDQITLEQRLPAIRSWLSGVSDESKVQFEDPPAWDTIARAVRVSEQLLGAADAKYSDAVLRLDAKYHGEILRRVRGRVQNK